jgi:aromatic-amino-acid transaminase
MNVPHSSFPLAAVRMAPRDPILGVTETFNADKNPNKVNLGVGVYYDDNGKVPLLECVRRAEAQLAEKSAPRSYLPIDGLPAYDRAVQAWCSAPTVRRPWKIGWLRCRRWEEPAD